ncbi:unnamed protein product [Urochloa decumbens]|uniref:Protein kinase domain-containing protein n=1 Tax=Urochloa decumbens TaxID=240449 RepID=A0ABC9FIK7_9POAL
MATTSSSPMFSLPFICLYCFFVLCMQVPSSSSVSFSYNFSDPSTDDPCGRDIVCHPDAEFVRSTLAIELTKNQQTGTITHSQGRIWYAHPVPLWDEVTGEVASFTTTFSFNITPTISGQYLECNNWTSRSGDGMTFFLAPWPHFSGGVVLANATGGGDLNIFNSSNHFNATGDSRVVAIEFDTFLDDNWDNSSNHIGIDINSIRSVATNNTLGMNNLTSPFTKAAMVRYNNSTNILTADLQIGDTLYHVSATVDLQGSLPGTVAIGFSASTGDCVELHELLSWSFNSTLETKADQSEPSTTKVKLLVRVLIPVTTVVLVCAGAGLLLWKTRTRRRDTQPYQGTDSDDSSEQIMIEADFERGVAGPRRYPYRDLAAATGEFDEENLLGRGGFGRVYQGHVPSYDGQQQQVAIKKFSSESSSQSRKEFEAEVKIIGRLRHRNLVRFVVWESCFLLLLSGNGEEIGWFGFLHGGTNEGGDGIYGVDNFLGAKTWRFRFPDGDIEAGMVPSSWNNFLRPLLRFVVVRSNHDERLVRRSLSPEMMSISLGSDRLGSVSLLHRWQNEEEERRKKEEKDCARSSLQECWSPFFGRLFSACLLSVCLCGLLFDLLHSRKGLLLVYELVPEGSLDKHIYSDNRVLTWPERYKIILGLGSALHYLHRDWDQRVVHGDIKPSNIMLDSSYNAKLGDFGLARLGDHGTGPQTTDLVRGTMGYIDPEFVNTHQRSTESDIYSFGIVLLEIVSGRPPVNRLDPSFSLLKWVQSLYCQGEGDILVGLLGAADARLRGDDDGEAHQRQMERALVVGLWCTQRDPGERPSIAEAMHVLQSEHCKLPALSLHMYYNNNPPPASVASMGEECGVSGSSFSSGIRSAAIARSTTGSSGSFANLPVLPLNTTW